jgi:aminoglycoside phosphotransferase (APT) family kinase protein
VIPLADVPAILLSRQLDAACPDPDRAAVIRRLAERLVADLAAISCSAAGQLTIHGDFTTHNVIAGGIPARPAGVIDFDRAHLEVPVADIGYGMWRSARPRQDASHLDLDWRPPCGALRAPVGRSRERRKWHSAADVSGASVDRPRPSGDLAVTKPTWVSPPTIMNAPD